MQKILGIGLCAIVLWTIPVLVVIEPSIGKSIGIEPVEAIKRWFTDVSLICDGNNWESLGFLNKFKGSIPVLMVLLGIGCILLITKWVFHIEQRALTNTGIVLLLISGIPLILLLVVFLLNYFSFVYVVLYPILLLLAIIFYLGLTIGITAFLIQEIKESSKNVKMDRKRILISKKR